MNREDLGTRLLALNPQEFEDLKQIYDYRSKMRSCARTVISAWALPRLSSLLHQIYQMESRIMGRYAYDRPQS